jgi:hypothetical protein
MCVETWNTPHATDAAPDADLKVVMAVVMEVVAVLLLLLLLLLLLSAGRPARCERCINLELPDAIYQRLQCCCCCCCCC